MNIWSLCSIDGGPNVGLYALVYGMVGVFKSTDGGLNWYKVTTWGSVPIFDNQYVVGLQAIDDTLYAVTSGGSKKQGGTVLKSTDGGASWQKVILGPGQFTGLYSAGTEHSDKLYTTIQGVGVFTSTDGGANWLDLNFNKAVSTLFSIDEGSDLGLYIVTNDNWLFKYGESTASWNVVALLYSLGIREGIDKVVNSIKYVYSGINSGLYVGTSGGFLKRGQ